MRVKKKKISDKTGFTVILPARWFDLPVAERNWVSDFIKETGRLRGEVAVVPCPGFIVGEIRDGLRFAERAWDDFKGVLMERMSDSPSGLFVFVGEAARPELYHHAMQFAPFAFRASIPFVGLPHSVDIHSVRHFSHFLIHPGGWNGGSGQKTDHRLCFAERGEDAARFLDERFREADALRPASWEAGPEGLSVVVAQRHLIGPAQKLVKDLGVAGEVIAAGGDGAGADPYFVALANSHLAKARFRRILFLNGSVVSSEGAERMMAYLEKNRLLGIIGAVPGRKANRGLPPLRVRDYIIHRENGKSVFPMAWLTRRSMLLRAGFLDGRFQTLDAAIADFCLRLRQMGYCVSSAGEIPGTGRAPGALTQGKQRQARLQDIRTICGKWSLDSALSIVSQGELREVLRIG